MTKHKPLTLNEEYNPDHLYCPDCDAGMNVGDAVYTLRDVRSAVEGLKNTPFMVKIDSVCLLCKDTAAIVVQSGPTKFWCRSCNIDYWFPVFCAEEKK